MLTHTHTPHTPSRPFTLLTRAKLDTDGLEGAGGMAAVSTRYFSDKAYAHEQLNRCLPKVRFVRVHLSTRVASLRLTDPSRAPALLFMFLSSFRAKLQHR